MKAIVPLFLTAMSFSAFASTAETVEIERKASVENFLASNEVTTLANIPVTQLTNITLKLKITDQGLIYTDEKNGLIFTNASAFHLDRNNQLTQIDRPAVDQYLDSVPDKIIVKAPNEKGVLTVFTDITCGWCQRVHEDLPAYLDLGITMEFILFPREGLQSQTALTMSAIEDSSNPAQMLNAMMHGQYPAMKPQSISSQLGEHFLAAKAMQINATPTMFYKGARINGYITPQALANMD